jgi:hypothetical protein
MSIVGGVLAAIMGVESLWGMFLVGCMSGWISGMAFVLLGPSGKALQLFWRANKRQVCSEAAVGGMVK